MKKGKKTGKVTCTLHRKSRIRRRRLWTCEPGAGGRRRRIRGRRSKKEEMENKKEYYNTHKKKAP